MQSNQPNNVRFSLLLLIVFILLTLGIIFISWISYQNSYRQFEADIERKLSAIVELKSEEIALWRTERKLDAAFFTGNKVFATLVNTYFNDPTNVASNGALQEVLSHYIAAYDYKRLLLVDATGQERLAIPARADLATWVHMAEVESYLSLEDPFFLDLHESSVGHSFHLTLVVPLLHPDDNSLLGLLTLYIDPSVQLYPMVQQVPVLSDLATFLLLRPEGDEFLLLNNPFPSVETALQMRLPKAETNCAPPEDAVQATSMAYGSKTAVYPIPNSSWLLALCANTDSLYAPIQDRGRYMAFSTLWLILLLGAGLLLGGRWQHALFYRQRYEMAQAAKAQAQADAQLLQNLAAHIPGVIFQYRRFEDGRSYFPYASDGIQTIYAVDPKEVKEDADPVFQRIHPDDLAHVMASIEASFQSGQMWHDTHRVILPERGERWLEGKATPQQLADGSVLWHGFINDITEQKQIEESLQESEKKYRTLYDQFIEGVFLHDLDGNILDANKIGVARSGYTKEELLQMSVFDLHPDQTEQEAILQAWATWSLDDQTTIETIHQRKDGSQYPVNVTIGKVSFDGDLLILAIVRDITDQKAQEQTIRQEQRRYQALFEQAHDAILIANNKGHYIEVNPAACTLLGYSYEEMLQCGPQDIIVPLETQNSDTLWHKFMQDRVQKGELWLQHKDGHLIPVEYRAVANFLPDRHFSILRDISERKTYEQQLLEAKHRYRSLFEQAHDAVFILSLDGHHEEFNQRASELFGYSRAELELFNFKDLSAEVEDSKEKYAQLLAGEHIPTYERILRKKDGTLIYAELNVELVHDLEGKPLHIQSVIRDITERKETIQELQHSEERFRSLVASLDDIVYTLDTEQRHTGVFGKWSPLSEAGDNPLIGKRASEIFGKQEAIVHETANAQALAGQPTIYEWAYQIDNETHHVQTKISPIYDDKQQIVGLVGVGRDITDLKQAQQKLEEAQDQLVQQERLAAIGQLAAGIAHDFNNILAVLLLYAQLMGQSDKLPKWEKEAISIIEKQTKVAANLVEQILDFSRQSILERVKLNWLPLLKEQMQLLQRTLPEYIDLTFRYSEADMYMVLGDSPRLQQMVLNLALNSRDAMPNGGELVFELSKVDLQEEKAGVPAGQWVKLQVRDTGEGIDEGTRRYIFEPFFTTKEPGKGSGLGLSQVQGIVAQHDGHIVLKTAVNQGTTFSIYLPAIATAPPPPPMTSDFGPIGQQETILLVEDNPTVRIAMEGTLDALNYQVITAEHGLDAITILEKDVDRIDLILSDMIMPKMGGAELLRHIYQEGWSVPMVIMTGHHLKEELDALLTLGLHSWVTKPVSLENLAQLLADLFVTKNK